MKVVTRNSVYTVRPCSVGFEVFRSADMWGRKVTAAHYHVTPHLRIRIGAPMLTTNLTTSPVLAVLDAS